jgi:hypothetical protein
MVEYKEGWLTMACEGAAKWLLVRPWRRQVSMAACCNVNGLAATAPISLAVTSDGIKRRAHPSLYPI